MTQGFVPDTLDSTSLEIYPSLAKLDAAIPGQEENERDARVFRIATELGPLLGKFDREAITADGTLDERFTTLEGLRENSGAVEHTNTPLAAALGFSFLKGPGDISIRTYPSPELLASAYQNIDGLTEITGTPAPIAYLGSSSSPENPVATGVSLPSHWLEVQRLGLLPVAQPDTQAHGHDLGIFDQHYKRAFRYNQEVNQVIQDILSAAISLAQDRLDIRLRSILDLAKHVNIDDAGDFLEDHLSPVRAADVKHLRNFWHYTIGYDEKPTDELVDRMRDAAGAQAVTNEEIAKQWIAKGKKVVLLEGVSGKQRLTSVV